MDWKALLAPVAVTILLLLCFGFDLALIFWLPILPGWGKLLLALVPLFCLGAAVWNLIERICEIKKEDHHDLDNY